SLMPSLRGAKRTKQSSFLFAGAKAGLLRFARNDGWDLHQPAAVGDAAEVVVGVPKGVLDHGQPLEVVADLGLLRHADAAMELDRLLADELSGFADLHLRRRHRGGAFLGIVEI